MKVLSEQQIKKHYESLLYATLIPIFGVLTENDIVLLEIYKKNLVFL